MYLRRALKPISNKLLLASLVISVLISCKTNNETASDGSGLNDSSVMTFYTDNPQIGDIYYFLKVKDDTTYELDMLIYDELDDKRLFALMQFKGHGITVKEPDILKLSANDMVYNSLKLSDGKDLPFPLDEDPKFEYNMATHSLKAFGVYPEDITNFNLDYVNELIKIQKNWDGSAIKLK